VSGPGSEIRGTSTSRSRFCPRAQSTRNGTFSLSSAAPGIIAELDRPLNVATGQGATSATGAKPALATISTDLCRQLKLVHWFLQRVLTSRIIWSDGGKQSSSALTTMNFLSAGAKRAESQQQPRIYCPPSDRLEHGKGGRACRGLATSGGISFRRARNNRPRSIARQFRNVARLISPRCHSGDHWRSDGCLRSRQQE
jgi:hypothetical protein